MRDRYWEAPAPEPLDEDDPMDAEEVNAQANVDFQGYHAGRESIEKALRQHIVVDRFPLPTAGIPHEEEHRASHVDVQYESRLEGSAASDPYAPFASRLDWEVARWAKLRGPGSTALSELLSIDGVRPIRS